MATTQDLLSLKKKIERDAATYTKLYEKRDNGEELTDSEKNALESIKTNVENIKKQNKTLTELPATTNLAIDKIVSKSYGEVTLFSYTPKNDVNKNSTVGQTSVDRDILRDNRFFYKHSKVVNNLAIGTTTQTFGIVDDLFNYTGQPTIKIEPLDVLMGGGSFLHDYYPITNKYSISFIVKLNRFPSKIYTKVYSKQITSRRTDLLEFKYADDSTIQFGAMAPFSRVTANKKGPNGEKVTSTIEAYQGKYSPFSFAASIRGGAGPLTSFYTDYKFELGKEYHVKFELYKTNEIDGGGDFGNIDNYRIEFYVNNILENISTIPCKVWGQSGNKAKKKNKVASQPNFMFSNVTQDMINNNEPISTEYKKQMFVRLGNFNINSLKSISSTPFIISQKETPTITSLINTGRSTNSLGKHYLYKINNGVDVGTITILTQK